MFSFLLEEGGNGAWTWVIMGALIVGMMLMSIIPNKRRQKKMQEMMSQIGIGSKVRTIGGFIGTIVYVDQPNNRYTINIAPDGEQAVNVVILQGAIASRLDPNAAAQPAPVTQNSNSTSIDKKDENTKF